MLGIEPRKRLFFSPEKEHVDFDILLNRRSWEAKCIGFWLRFCDHAKDVNSVFNPPLCEFLDDAPCSSLRPSRKSALKMRLIVSMGLDRFGFKLLVSRPRGMFNAANTPSLWSVRLHCMVRGFIL